MTAPLSSAQLTGKDGSQLVELGEGAQLHPQAAAAFRRLQAAAAEAGFQLAIASAHRSFARQCAIWDAKASGRRPVHDDAGEMVDLAALSAPEQAHAILRFSALPGTSRHHWGTDLDVYDAAAVPADYRVQLTPDEVAPAGPFGPLHAWLDARMAADRSEGFFRPYAQDRGGVAVERWHLSYAPLSVHCESMLDAALLRACWSGEELLLREVLEAELPALLARYVHVPADWCPARYRRPRDFIR